jgi:flagellar FliL protein
MADEEPEQEDAPPKKKSKVPLLIGLVLALALGGGGFYAVSAGLILAPADAHAEADADMAMDSPLPDVAFIPIQPLIINLGRDGANTHLRFQAQLEVPKASAAEVEAVLPRVVDVLNSYLRAVGPAELENPAALVRLRAQMLRRVQVVTGGGRVRDLLIMEFVLN